MPGRKRGSAARPAAPPQVLPPEVDDALAPVVDDRLISSVYEEIRSLQRDATIELAVKMGELIVKRFYGGRLEAWREHGPKESSLRKLAAKFEDDESGMSAAGIYRVVAIYELDQRLDVSSRKRLTVTHIRAVLGLPPAEQKRLLDQAEAKGWSTRQLEDKAAGVRKREGDGRGRPPLPAFVKTANWLGKLVEQEDSFGDLDALEGMDEDAVEATARKVTSMREKLEELEEKLQERLQAKRAVEA
jgi:chaperonin cofactor prefoldin